MDSDKIREIYLHHHNNMADFGRDVAPEAFYAETPAFHYEIYSVIMNQSLKRVGIAAPRSHAKSMAATKINTLWHILHKPVNEIWPIVIISESESQSNDFLYDIKRILAESSVIKDVYEPLWGHGFDEEFCRGIDECKWTESTIILPNRVKLSAKGARQRIRGVNYRNTRPRLIIMDDFESEFNCDTLEAAIKNRKWVTNTVIPALHDDGRILAICNLVQDWCFMVWVKDNPSWKTLWYQAIDDDWKTPLWPQRFSVERLKKYSKI